MVVDLRTIPHPYLSIADPLERITKYDYIGNYLTKITYPDNKVTTIGYDANNRLLSITSPDEYKMVYSYTLGQTYRVNKVQENHTDGTLGQTMDKGHILSFFYTVYYPNLAIDNASFLSFFTFLTRLSCKFIASFAIDLQESRDNRNLYELLLLSRILPKAIVSGIFS